MIYVIAIVKLQMSRPLQVIELIEYQCCSEPVVLDAHVAETIRDRLGRYLDIRPTWKPNNTYWLSARQYVGDIIVDNVHIRIHSTKAPMSNLFWMLTFADDLAQFRNETAHYQEEDSLFEFLVAIFAQQVERLIRHGLYQSYLVRHGDQPRLKGKLNIARQLSQNHVHPERFAIRWADHTRDVLENRLLKPVLLRLASVRYPRQIKLSHRLRKAHTAFAGVMHCPICVADFDQVRYTQLNQHYRGPLSLARLLYQHLSVRNELGLVPFATYLFDLNLLFERFIAAFLCETIGCSCLEVRPKHATALDQALHEHAEMDIVLLRDGQPVLVMDTKYKTYDGKPARHDLNQIFTYCHTLQVKRGVLLYPGAAFINDSRLMTGVRVDMRNVSLGGDLAQVKANLSRLVDDLVQMSTYQDSALTGTF